MKKVLGLPLRASLFILAGCQMIDQNQDHPALLDAANDSNRISLQNVIAEAMNTEVMLAPDALTKSSMLVIQHNPPRTMQNTPAQGRMMEMPARFQLVKNGADCVLIDQRNNERHLLLNATCVPE